MEYLVWFCALLTFGCLVLSALETEFENKRLYAIFAGAAAFMTCIMGIIAH